MSVSRIPVIDHRDAGAALRRQATPIALAVAGDQLLGIADTIVIGALGTAPLAGITGATSIFIVLVLGLFAFGSGLRIAGAQAIGAGDADRFGAVVRSAMIVPLGIAIAAALASLFAAVPLLHVILPAGAPLDASARYLILRCVSLIPMAAGSSLAVAFATAGEPRVTMRLLLVINAIHVPLVVVLALGVGTHHALGLTGAGISSLVAELFGLVYLVVATARRPDLRIFSSWRISLPLLRQTTSLSWPEYVFLTLQVLPEPLTVALLAPAGTETVAAFRALSLVSDLSWALPGSLGDAAETILGQRIGARDIPSAIAFARAAVRIGIRVCFYAGAGIALFAWPLAALCTLDPRLATIAALPLAAHVGLTLPLKAWSMTALAPIRAAGDTRFVMFMGIAVTVVAFGLIVVGIRTLHLGLWAIPLGWTFSWALRGAVTTMRARGGDWQRRSLAVAS
jgi:putative MATE family efflux protein